MCTKIINTYIIFERIINLVPGPSNLYMPLWTLLFKEIQEERKKITALRRRGEKGVKWIWKYLILLLFVLKIIYCLCENDNCKYVVTWQGWFEIRIHKISLSEDCGIRFKWVKKKTQLLSNSTPTENANWALVKFGTCLIRHLGFANLHYRSSTGFPWYLVD